MSDVTQILAQIEQGDPHAANELLPLVYEELRKLAAAKFAQERPDHTLQATALVHDAYIRLVDVDQAQHWNSRGHFFAAAATAMRRILVDTARNKQSLRRGGNHKRRELLAEDLACNPQIENFVELDEALSRLAIADPQAAKLVELRVFVGLTTEEAAETLDIPAHAAKRSWAYARAWLRREMHDESRKFQLE